MKPKLRYCLPLASAIAALLAAPYAHAQSWSGTTSGAWLTTTNWTGGVAAGESTITTDTDIAVFNVTLNPTIGINMNTTSGVYYLGAIDVTQNTTRTFNNSSTTAAGVLTLNGATVNSVANTILRNSSQNLTTITNGTGVGTLGLALGNVTNNIVQITGGGGITIASNITGTSRNLTLQASNHGSGILTLSGTNSYTGNTRIDAGTVQFTSQAALYNNGTAAAWSKDNVVVSAGGAAFFTMGGAGQFTAANINTLLGLSDSASNGFRSQATIGLDVSGGSVSYTNAIANPNSDNNVLNVTKLGASTLTLEQNNTYTGRTFISAGTLRLGNGGTTGSLSSSSAIRNNGTLTINRSNAVAQGTDFSAAPIIGTGALIQLGAGTTTLNAANTFTGSTTVSGGVLNLTNALALQNSALVTTGAGTLTLTSPTTLTLGGLSGATGDLATVISSGFTGTVTALTLNTAVAGPFTYGGIIDNGAMTFTKTGTGTQILSGANLYTGATIVNAGTLTVGSGATGSLSNSSPLQMGGGIFNYSNTGAVQTLNGLSVNAGNSAVNNTAIGQTLTLGAITRTASVFGTVNFATLTGAISTTAGNINSILGPWATTGTITTLRYAVGSPDGSTPTNISALTGTTATAGTLADVTDATVNYEYSAAATTATDLTANTLRYSGAASATAIGAANTLTLNGLMQAGTGLLTISGGPSTGGILIGSTNELVIAANAQATTISAVIANGGAAGRLVYSGGAGALTLSGANLHTGGTVLNSGTVLINNANSFGAGVVTINGSSRINATGGITYVNPITVNAGQTLTLQNPTNAVGPTFSTATFSGVVSGSGNLFLTNSGTNAIQGILAFTNTANTFTGNVVLSATGSGDEHFKFNSIGDGGNFTFAKNGNRQLITYTGSSDVTFNTRQIVVAATMFGVTDRQGLDGGGANPVNIFSNDGSGTISFTQDMVVDNFATNYGVLYFGGTNTGDNTLSGNISDTSGSSKFAIGKFGAGKWILSGTNTYEGNTLIAGGTLSVGTIANFSTPQPLGIGTAIQLGVGNSNANGTLLYTGGTASTDKQIQIGAVNNAAGSTGGGSILNDGAGALSFTNPSFNLGSTGVTGTRTLTLGGSNAGANTITGIIQNNATAGLVALTKAGTGTWVLGGANTYTGNTIVNTGTLELADNAQLRFVLGATSGTNNSISGSGTVTLEGDFVINTTAADALASGSWTLENVATLTGAYGTNFTVVGFVNAGGDKWTKVNGAKLYTFDETTGILALANADTYASWASGKGLTGLAGSSTDPAKSADPDGDGNNNLYEFAFDGNPLSGASDGKIVGKIATVGAAQVLTLTLPVRGTATPTITPAFAVDSGDQLSALIDGLYYRIEGDVTLTTFADAVTEVTGTDATTIQSTMPPLSGVGWTYRTFRAPDTVPTAPKAFLRAKISETP